MCLLIRVFIPFFRTLEKFFHLVEGDKKGLRILFPLCGKSFDMKWYVLFFIQISIHCRGVILRCCLICLSKWCWYLFQILAQLHIGSKSIQTTSKFRKLCIFCICFYLALKVVFRALRSLCLSSSELATLLTLGESFWDKFLVELCKFSKRDGDKNIFCFICVLRRSKWYYPWWK